MSIHPTILADIAAERERQRRKGYDAAHDDDHDSGELMAAASHVAFPRHDFATALETSQMEWICKIEEKWAHDPYRRAIIAAALLIAEAERLDRKRQIAIHYAHVPDPT